MLNGVKVTKGLLNALDSVKKPQTNADRIRSMTDQELAVFLSRDLKQPCDYCQLEDLEGACTETLCDDAMMKWLQHPAEKPEEDAM